MAKIVTQSIPSEDRIWYKRNFQIATTRKGSQYVRTRYPWRVPKMQAGGPGVSPAQEVNRDKFMLVIQRYALLDATAKARWAAANPEYNSYLFGYNFFMLEGFLGGGPTDFPQMIKSIQVVKEEVPASGTKSFAIAAVDPGKCVVLIQGSSVKWPAVQRFYGTAADNSEVTENLSPNIDVAVTEVKAFGSAGYQDIADGTGQGNWSEWTVSSLSASQVKIKLADIASAGTFPYYIEVTEHKEAIIYPVLVSIAAEAVVIDWATVPSTPADVSITVVEYL